jgi:hypothetical protein
MLIGGGKDDPEVQNYSTARSSLWQFSQRIWQAKM